MKPRPTALLRTSVGSATPSKRRSRINPQGSLNTKQMTVTARQSRIRELAVNTVASKRSLSTDRNKVSNLTVPSNRGSLLDFSEDCTNKTKQQISSFSFNDPTIRPDVIRFSKKNARGTLLAQAIAKKSCFKTTIKADNKIGLAAASMSERNRIQNFFLNDYVASLFVTANGDEGDEKREEVIYRRTRDRLEAIDRARTRALYLKIVPGADKSLRALAFAKDLKSPSTKMMPDERDVDRRHDEHTRAANEGRNDKFKDCVRMTIKANSLSSKRTRDERQFVLAKVNKEDEAFLKAMQSEENKIGEGGQNAGLQALHDLEEQEPAFYRDRGRGCVGISFQLSEAKSRINSQYLARKQWQKSDVHTKKWLVSSNSTDDLRKSCIAIKDLSIKTSLHQRARIKGAKMHEVDCNIVPIEVEGPSKDDRIMFMRLATTGKHKLLQHMASKDARLLLAKDLVCFCYSSLGERVCI